MSLFRLQTIIKYELLRNVRRRFIWIFLGITLLVTKDLFSSPGVLKIARAFGSSGPISINNEFVLAFFFGILTLVLFTHLIAIMMTDPIEKDYSLKIREILFSTPVTEREYVLGKFFGNFLVIFFIFTVQVILMVALQYFPPKYFEPSPVRFLPYVKTFLIFNLVYVAFVSALCFWGGAQTKNPKLIYALVTFLYLIVWVPLSLRVDAFKYIDVTSVTLVIRFLETSHGIEYFDAHPLPVDPVLVLNRLVTVGIAGLALVVCTMKFRKVDS